MSISEDFLTSDDLHPIDIVETLAAHHDWEFDRVTDDQIAMAVEGQWRLRADAGLVGAGRLLRLMRSDGIYRQEVLKR